MDKFRRQKRRGFSPEVRMESPQLPPSSGSRTGSPQAMKPQQKGGDQMRQRKGVSISIVCLALAALTLVTLPGLPGIPSVSAQTKPLLKIRINKIPIAPYVPAEVALSRGWFKEEGLDVVIETVAPGAVALQ